LDIFPLTFHAFSIIYPSRLSGNNSAVECNLAKVEVAGSNPVSRSTDDALGGNTNHPFFVISDELHLASLLFHYGI
jgi:hypothetical protein